MPKDYKAYASDVDARAANLFKAAPDAMRAFRGLAEESAKAGALDSKTKELMSLGIAVAVRCEGCIVYHVKAALRHGATRDEVAETVAVAVQMGGGPSVVYGGEALEAFDQLAA